MNEIHTVHFEELWERCEKLSSSVDPKQIIGQLAGSIGELRDIYKASESSSDKRFAQGMKEKAIGRLLLTLTTLSAAENIDVYKALKEQWDAEQAREALISP